MNPQRIPPAFVFLVLANLISSVQSEPLNCINNGNNYTANSTYSANLNTALSSLSTNIDINGFYNVSVGQTPDRVNAAALCRGDVLLNRCRRCIQDSAAELLRSCPNQKQALDWPDFCIVRYSNEAIFGKVESEPPYWSWYGLNTTSPDLFRQALKTLLDHLRALAAHGGSLRKVAAGNANVSDFQTIFALVQCTPDLSVDDCNSCLIGAAAEIPTCCDGKEGGRLVKINCNIRYNIHPFYNETRLQELAPAPPPVPVVEPAMQSPPGNGDGNKTRRTFIIVAVSIAASVIFCFDI